MAQTLAAIKLVLATANFGVILLDSGVPVSGDVQSLRIACLAALAFWFCPAIAYVGIRRKWFHIRSYSWISPLVDIAAASALILATDGHASPFNTWLVLIVVATGFSPDRRIPLMATMVAIAAHISIALVPQAVELNPALLVVRTTYLFGFAAMVAVLGGALSRQARALGAVERTGAALAAAKSETEATELLFSGIQRLLDNPELALRRGRGPMIRMSGQNKGERIFTLPLGSGSSDLGELIISRSRPVSESEQMWAQLLSERYATAVSRIRLSIELLAASTRAERVRMADEIHDGYLQTLTAVGFYLESMKTQEASPEDLTELCGMVRHATVQARKLIEPFDGHIAGGEDHLLAIFAERWKGPYSIAFDPDVDLSEGQWQVMEMLVKEGLNNAIRHGHATTARLVVNRADGRIYASLDSNGNEPSSPVEFGYGLKRLRGLAVSNGGELYLEAGAEGGTCLKVVFEPEELL
ncbi:MAG: sensor histidine kinase [Fimbriimonas sp.]